MDVTLSIEKHISRWVDLENLILLEEIAWKAVHKDEEGDQ